MGGATPILTLCGTNVPGEHLSERWLSTEHHVCAKLLFVFRIGFLKELLVL